MTRYISRRHPNEVAESDWTDVTSPAGTHYRIEGHVSKFMGWADDDTPIFVSHEQASVETPAGDLVEVDAGLALALVEIWRRGYQAVYSCEGGTRGDTYVMFATDSECARFSADVLVNTPHEASGSSIYVASAESLSSALGSTKENL